MGVDSGEDVFEVFIGVDAVGSAGADEGIENGGCFAAAFAAEKHVVLFAEAERAENIFAGKSRHQDFPAYPHSLKIPSL